MKNISYPYNEDALKLKSEKSEELSERASNIIDINNIQNNNHHNNRFRLLQSSNNNFNLYNNNNNQMNDALSCTTNESSKDQFLRIIELKGLIFI